MGEFISNLSSLYWWISVVIVGILINLFSSYLQKVLDRRISNTSLWWRKRLLTRRDKRNKEIVKLREDPNYRFVIQTRIIFNLFFSLILIVSSFSIVTISTLYKPSSTIDGFLVSHSMVETLNRVLTYTTLLAFFLSVRSAADKRELIEDAFARGRDDVGMSNTSSPPVFVKMRERRERRER